MPDAEAQRTQVEEALKQRYFPMIPEIAEKWTPEQHERNRLSRSLAAFAIEKLADVAPAQAANAVVDGGNDNGIDAVYFDRAQNRLWVVQSKAGGPPSAADNKKFCDGIRDLVARRFDRFNASFARLLPDIKEALEVEDLQIIGCQVHLGNQLGPHATTDLAQLKTDLNQFFQRFDWQDSNLLVVHSWLTSEHAIEPLDLTLVLENRYGMTDPRRAFYGQVTARQLADLYKNHGNALFQKNIRHYLGAQAVNSAISATVTDRPGELFFPNNGLTATCAKITPDPGASNIEGTFNLHGFSVVNGAQTVGSIAMAHANPEEISPDAKVLITLIEIGEAADTLGQQITRARNTQNAVRGLDFAALDPQQERLRQDLAVSGIVYHYRPAAEAAVRDANHITIEQAAIALACLSGDTRTIVAANKESSQIYDQLGEYYPSLFRDGLSGIQLCRAVRIFDYL